MTTDPQTLLTEALAGRRSALRALVDHLTPVVQARVARSLLRREAGAAGRNVRQEVEDLSQEVFVALFANDARILRSWAPEKGLSLRNYVGLVSERKVSSIMRSGKRSPWTEHPTESASLERASGSAAGAESQVIHRELLAKVITRLREELTPKGLHLFQLIMIEQREVAEVCEITDMKPDAVYAWRSRLAKRVRGIAEKLQAQSVGRSEKSASRRRSGQSSG